MSPPVSFAAYRQDYSRKLTSHGIIRVLESRVVSVLRRSHEDITKLGTLA